METLYISMLGGFNVQYHGASVKKAGNVSPRYLQFFQMVLLAGESGVRYETARRALYGTDELKKPANCMNNLCYQLRGKMTAAGLPETDYIVHRNKVYYPDPEIDLRTDVSDFKSLIISARQESGDSAAELYKKAFELYKGPLLPENRDCAWTEQERIRLIPLYREAADFLIKKAAADGDTELSCKVTEVMFHIHPEIAKYEEKPKSALNENSDSFLQAGEVIRMMDIQNSSNHAYRCSTECFTAICREMKSVENMAAMPMHVMVFTIADYSKKPVIDEKKLLERTAVLDEFLSEKLRKGDVYARISHSQYAVLMIGYSRQERGRFMRSIRKMMREVFSGTVKILWSEAVFADIEEC